MRMPRQSVSSDLASAIGFFEPIVAEGITWISSAGNFPAKRSARLSVTRWTAYPRAFNSCPSASAGNR
jgi:hypothetical protein